MCLLYVIEPVNGYGMLAMDPIVPLPVLDCREALQIELEKIAKEEFPPTTSVSVYLRHGVPYDQIVSAAAELNADLIVIATHGRRGLPHTLLGSLPSALCDSPRVWFLHCGGLTVAETCGLGNFILRT